MKILALSKRNFSEVARDPLGLVFCLALPLFMLILISVISGNIQDIPLNFRINSYASGICVFGYTFICLFVAMQIAGDKNSSFIKRIDISPVSKFTYYCGFFVSSLPIAFIQTVLFFAVALLFGYPFNWQLALNILYLMPSAALYIFMGILIGCICGNEKQTGPVSSIFISLTGMLGGIFMPISLFTGGLAKFIDLLPFGHSVQIGSDIFIEGASCIYPHILFILFYCLLTVAAIIIIEGIKKYRK